MKNMIRIVTKDKIYGQTDNIFIAEEIIEGDHFLKIFLTEVKPKIMCIPYNEIIFFTVKERKGE